MSAGPFTYSKYTDDNGTVRPIQVQPETQTLWTALGWTAPGADAEGNQVIVSGSKRKRGVTHARTVSIKNATPPSGYKASSPISLPIPTAAVYGALPKVGQALGQNYLGISGWTIVGKSPERGTP